MTTAADRCFTIAAAVDGRGATGGWARTPASAGVSVDGRASAGGWARNTAVNAIAVAAILIFTIRIIIFLETQTFPADVIGESRKAFQ